MVLAIVFVFCDILAFWSQLHIVQFFRSLTFKFKNAKMLEAATNLGKGVERTKKNPSFFFSESLIMKKQRKEKEKKLKKVV